MEMAEKTKKRRNIMIGIETSVFKIGVRKRDKSSNELISRVRWGIQDERHSIV